MEFEEFTLRELLCSSLANQTAKLLLDTATYGVPVIVQMQDGSQVKSEGLLPTLHMLRERFGWSPRG